MKNKIRLLAACGTLALLAACSNPAPISSNPVTTVTNIVSQANPGAGASAQAIQTQLLNAEWNLDQAVTIGILTATDPVDQCVHQVNTQLGIEPVAPGGTAPTPAAQFTPRMTGLLDSGAVAYILAQQAQKLTGGGITVPTGCKAIIGDLVIKGGTGAIKLLPGGSLLPTLN